MNISLEEVYSAINSLGELRHEVLELRAENDRLRQKAEAYDALVTVLGVRPKLGGTMAQDPISQANRVADRLLRMVQQQPKPAATEQPSDPA